MTQTNMFIHGISTLSTRNHDTMCHKIHLKLFVFVVQHFIFERNNNFSDWNLDLHNKYILS